MALLICILLVRGFHLEPWWYAVAVAVWILEPYVPRPALFKKKEP